MLQHASTIFGAVDSGLGNSGVLDPGLGTRYVADFAKLVSPVLGDWKIGWTTWLLCDQGEVAKKIEVLKDAGATVIAGGTAGEIAASRGEWRRYTDLCASLGFDRIELAEGFLGDIADPARLVDQAKAVGLDVQYEVGRKDQAEDEALSLRARLATVDRWLEAGASYFVIEAREVGAGYAMFDGSGAVNSTLADELLRRMPLANLIVETPNRPTFTAALRHFGPGVHLGNVAPADLLRVETMRRALHADTIALREKWLAR